MTIELAVTCECCQGDITSDGETYCEECWRESISALPRAEKLIRALGKRLGGDGQRTCERVADHLYDLNFNAESAA